jgi:hypothetical protein
VEESKDAGPASGQFWTDDPDHPFARETPLVPASPTAAAVATPRQASIPWRDQDEARKLYDNLIRASLKDGDFNSYGGNIEGKGVAHVFRNTVTICGPGKTILDAGSSCGALAAWALLFFQLYIGVEVVAQTMWNSRKALESKLPSGSGKRVFIALANLLRLPPVVTGVDVLYGYLSTIPAEMAIYVHLLEICWRSLCITVFVFHSRFSRVGASPLELLLGSCDPSYRPLGRGGACTEHQLLKNRS